MKKKIRNNIFALNTLLILFVASICIACNKQTLYYSFQSIPNQGWSQKDTLNFEMQIADSTTFYNLFVEIRNRNNYPYQNLPLLLQCFVPQNGKARTDTINLTLADKEGTWKGNGWGGLYQIESPARKMRIDKAGKYKFKIISLLPDTLLPGINDIGIRIERQ